jgi:hypothetical protein
MRAGMSGCRAASALREVRGVGKPADAVTERVVDALEVIQVELVALCGLYGLIGAIVTSFEIPIEEGLPQAPF